MWAFYIINICMYHVLKVFHWKEPFLLNLQPIWHLRGWFIVCKYNISWIICIIIIIALNNFCLMSWETTVGMTVFIYQCKPTLKLSWPLHNRKNVTSTCSTQDTPFRREKTVTHKCHIYTVCSRRTFQKDYQGVLFYNTPWGLRFSI